MNLSPRSLLAWMIISALHCWIILLVTNSNTFKSLTPFLNPLSAFTSSSSPTTAAPFLNAIKTRRTYYALNKTLPVSNDHITKIVEESIQAVPSAFNSQSNRAVVLFGAEHDTLWDIVADVVKDRVSEDQWDSASQRITGFKAAAGTVRPTSLWILLRYLAPLTPSLVFPSVNRCPESLREQSLTQHHVLTTTGPSLRR